MLHPTETSSNDNDENRSQSAASLVREDHLTNIEMNGDELQRDDEETKRHMKETFLDWLSSSTAHGLPSLSRTERNAVKIIWILCFVASSTYCFYAVISLIVDFFAYEVLINIQIVDQTPVDFPAVTICNLNPLDRRNSSYYIDKVLAANNLTYVNDINKIDMFPSNVLYLVNSAIAADKNLTWTQKKYFGFQLDYMFLSCTFNNVPCTTNDFIWVYDFNYGNCYTFNSGKDQFGNQVPIKQINEAGSDRGFQLQIFLGNEFLQGIFMVRSGARVVVHNQSDVPLPKSEGRDLSTNYQTNIGITKSFLSKLSSPYSDCVKDIYSPNGFSSNYYKSMFNTLNMTKYRQKVCLSLCQQDFIKSNCKCLDASLPIIYEDYPICSTISQINCVLSSQANYSSIKNECPDCPLECDSVYYRTKQSRSRYPTLYYTNYIFYQTNLASRFEPGVVINENFIQKNIVLLNVFFDDVSTTYITEVPAITFDYLLGNVGGYFGLFIGLSFLSFIELIEIVFSIFIIYFKIKKQSFKEIEKTLKF